MGWLSLCFGISGLLVATICSSRVDQFFYRLPHRMRRLFGEKEADQDEQRLVVQQVIAGLRSGVALDATLERVRGGLPAASPLRAEIGSILQALPPVSLLGRFLSGALRSGSPGVASLLTLDRALSTRKKLELKARSHTSQSRAQAILLSWLPWLMAGALALLHPEWILEAAADSFSWLLWALALGLTGIGHRWIQVQIDGVLSPASEQERLEERCFPELALGVLGEMAAGKDADAAWDSSVSLLREAKPGELAESTSLFLGQLRKLCREGARSGAPLRESLLQLLGDFQSELECRWESRVQRLPVLLLLPLFTCFFPGCLLVLAGALLPLFRVFG